MAELIEESAEYFDATYEKVESESPDQNDSILEVRRGPLQSIGKENQNGRVYTEDFWSHVFSSEEVRERLERKLFLGRLSHPNSGDVEFDLNYVSHTVSDFWKGRQEEDEDPNLVYGDVEIIDTDAGRKLQTFFDAGIDLGFSSRSLVVPNEENGTEYIEKGSIWGWDAVLNQSVGSAYGLEELSESGRKLNFDDFSDQDRLVNQLESSRESNENVQVVCEAINFNDENQDMGNVTEEDVKELEKEVSKLEKENQDLKDELQEQNEVSVSEVHKLAREKQEAMDIAGEAMDLFEEHRDRWRSKFEDLKESYKEDLEKSITEIETLQESVDGEDQKRKASEAIRIAEQAVSELEEWKDYEPYVQKAIEKLEEIPEYEKVAEEAIDHLERVKNEREEVADIAMDLVEMVEEKEDTIQELRDEALEAINEAEQEVAKREKRAQVESFAESCLHDLGMNERDDVRDFFYESETLEDVKEKYETVKGLIENNKMPSYKIEEELRDEVGEEVDEEVQRVERIIGKSAGRKDRPTR